MPARRLVVTGTALLVAGGVYAALAIFAGPAPQHAFFEAAPRVEVIAHRGGGALRPENTLEAFAHVLALGADMVEIDLRVTADGAIVALHDSTVDRTTDGSGAVEAMTLEALRRLDAGFRWTPDARGFPFRGQGLRVPTLEEVFARLPEARLLLEMKRFTPASAAALCGLVRKAGVARKVIVASFGDEPMRAFRAECPEVATSMSAAEARWFYFLSRAAPLPAPALHLPDRLDEWVLVTEGLVAAARRRGLKLHVFTVNEEARMRELVALGVDGIMTDRPDLLLRVLGR